MTVTFIVLFCSTTFPVSVWKAKAQYIVPLGVKDGDWFVHSISVSSSDPLLTQELEKEMFIEWINYTVHIPYVREVWHYKNGTEVTVSKTELILYPIIGQSSKVPLIVSANLTNGDAVYSPYEGRTFYLNGTLLREYAGVMREANYLIKPVYKYTYEGDGYDCILSLYETFYWDKLSGILCEYNATVIQTCDSSIVKYTILYKISETNIWRAPLSKAQSSPGSKFSEPTYSVDWSMFQHDPSHTGYSISTAPNTNNTLWIFSVGSKVRTPLVMVDGRVFVGSHDHKIYCLNENTGELIWSYTTGGVVRGSPAVSDGRVYFGSDDHKVYCLNASTGSLIWSYSTGDYAYTPTVVNNRVYVGSADHKVYCLDAITGSQIWIFTMGDMGGYAPAVFDNKVYVGSDDYTIYCLNATNGNLIWRYYTGYIIGNAPTISGDRLLVGSWRIGADDGYLYCLNASTGHLIWNFRSRVERSPAVYNGKIYVHGNLHGNNQFYCLNISNGKVLWSYPNPTGTKGGFSSAAVADGKVYVGHGVDVSTWRTGGVYCLNATTGSLIWSYMTSCPVFSSPAVANGKVFVGSDDGKVYCFGSIEIVNVDSFFIDENNDGIPGLKEYEQVWVDQGSPVYERGEMKIEMKIIVEGGMPPFDFEYTLKCYNFSIEGIDRDGDDVIRIDLQNDMPIGNYSLRLKVIDTSGNTYIEDPVDNKFIYIIFSPTDIEKGYLTRTIVYTDIWHSSMPIPGLVYNSIINPVEMFLEAIKMADKSFSYSEATNLIDNNLSSLLYRNWICYETDVKNYQEMKEGKGSNCAGHTVVFISIARALKIPVREVLLYIKIWGVVLPYHEFAEFYNGSDWIPADPTNHYTGWEEFKIFLNRLNIYSVIAHDFEGNEIDRTSVYKYKQNNM